MDQSDSAQGNVGASAGTGSTSTPGGQQNSVDINAVLAALETNPKFAEVLERRLQATKDQRFSKQDKRLSAFEEKLARLEELQKDGMSRKQAMSFMEIEDRLDAITNGKSSETSQPDKPNVVSGSGSVDTDAFLKAVGIDPTDPEVTALYKSGSVTPDQLVNFVTKKKTAAPAPNSAQAAPSAGQSGSQTLEEQYTAEVRKYQPGSQEIFEVRRKYRKLGLNI